MLDNRILNIQIKVALQTQDGCVVLYEHYKKSWEMVFKKADSIDSDHQITAIGEKLDGLTKVLKLYPYDKNGQFQGKLKPISHASIQAAQVVCPNAIVCETTTCNPRSLLQITKVRDIPREVFTLPHRFLTESGYSCG